MQEMNYAVIGAGNGGKLLATLIASKGHPVALTDKNPAVIAEIDSWDRTIEVVGRITCRATIPVVTTDLLTAVEDADVVLVATTADCHDDLAYDLAPMVHNGQIFILNPGQTGGLLAFYNALRDRSGKRIVVGTVQDLIYGCRVKEPGVVNCSAAKKVMDFIACPVPETPRLMELLKDIFPQLRHAKNILAIDFDNMSAMIHPAPTLLNAGRTECGESYTYYAEGITPSVARLLEAMDAERIAVGSAYGVEVTSLAQWQKTAYDVEGEDLYHVFQNNPYYRPVKSDLTIDNRYVTEDVPCGLVPLCEYGRAAGIPTPAMDAVISLACAMLGRDFRATGRTLAKLGLEGLSVDAICEKLNSLEV